MAAAMSKKGKGAAKVTNDGGFSSASKHELELGMVKFRVDKRSVSRPTAPRTAQSLALLTCSRPAY